ncbi:DUF2829 domain-containing protein [Pseudomonas sp. GL-B-16]|uniref:DUF2829 domain-containing protein n=1 Tax=Pseudomonas sp. GL-B-16 TaxID=2832373 RepID=UPI001CBE8BBB|nr:DUF2829 domain-containing protein [Pseudomonas sp. GL-B-16]
MTNITRNPLLQQAYEVCQAIEQCGASVELTNAVTKASALLGGLDKLIPETPISSGMSFGLAIEAVKLGQRVARAGWNGKGMWLFLIQGSNDIAKLNGYGFGEHLGEPVFRDSIFMRTVDNQLVPWTASQTDVLAEDWTIVGAA